MDTLDIKTFIFFFDCDYYTVIYINDKKYTYGEIMDSEIKLHKIKSYTIGNSILFIKTKD